jgi:hypothetical protein
MPVNRGTARRNSARQARRVQPTSVTLSRVRRLRTRLAMREEALRTQVSRRWARTPLTTS